MASATDLGGLFPGSDVTDVPGFQKKEKKEKKPTLDGLINFPKQPRFW